MSPRLLRREGRRAFGRDPAGYARYRLDYPRRVFDVLERRCGLRRGSAVFEIGPGTGIASRQLLASGADPLCLIEPDPRLARYLNTALGRARSRAHIVNATFEEARLPEGVFDLGTAATSFHWVDEYRALPKIARWLRPGGWWAMWWNRHGDPDRPTEFQRVTMPAVGGYSPKRFSQWVGESRRDRRREVDRRLGHLRTRGRFERVGVESIAWTTVLTAHEVRGLYGTFGYVGQMAPRRREAFLTELERIAREEFGGRIRYPMQTLLFTARRSADPPP